jgi:hypothetical protein
MSASPDASHAMPNRIFLSHSGRDKARVVEIEALLRAVGYDPWLDMYDMLPSAVLHEGIYKGMQESRAVVFFLTTNFVYEKYLKKEILYAIQLDTDRGDALFAIIPILLPDKDGNYISDKDIPPLLTPYVRGKCANDLVAATKIISVLAGKAARLSLPPSSHPPHDSPPAKPDNIPVVIHDETGPTPGNSHVTQPRAKPKFSELPLRCLAYLWKHKVPAILTMLPLIVAVAVLYFYDNGFHWPSKSDKGWFDEVVTRIDHVKLPAAFVRHDRDPVDLIIWPGIESGVKVTSYKTKSATLRYLSTEGPWWGIVVSAKVSFIVSIGPSAEKREVTDLDITYAILNGGIVDIGYDDFLRKTETKLDNLQQTTAVEGLESFLRNAASRVPTILLH